MNSHITKFLMSIVSATIYLGLLSMTFSSCSRTVVGLDELNALEKEKKDENDFGDYFIPDLAKLSMVQVTQILAKYQFSRCLNLDPNQHKDEAIPQFKNADFKSFKVVKQYTPQTVANLSPGSASFIHQENVLFFNQENCQGSKDQAFEFYHEYDLKIPGLSMSIPGAINVDYVYKGSFLVRKKINEKYKDFITSVADLDLLEKEGVLSGFCSKGLSLTNTQLTDIAIKEKITLHDRDCYRGYSTMLELEELEINDPLFSLIGFSNQLPAPNQLYFGKLDQDKEYDGYDGAGSRHRTFDPDFIYQRN